MAYIVQHIERFQQKPRQETIQGAMHESIEDPMHESIKDPMHESMKNSRHEPMKDPIQDSLCNDAEALKDKHILYVIGIGPGNPDYVVPKGLRLIEAAPVLVGSERALADFAKPHQRTFSITGKLKELITWLQAQLATQDVVVLVSGDTGYYSLLPYLKKNIKDYPIEVVPGISSMTFAFARLREVWQDADLLSFHGRVPPEDALLYKPMRKLGFLTDKIHNGAAIAKILMDHGWPKNCRIVGCERLSYEDEHIEEFTLQSMSQSEGFEHAVIIAFAGDEQANT